MDVGDARSRVLVEPLVAYTQQILDRREILLLETHVRIKVAPYVAVPVIVCGLYR